MRKMSSRNGLARVLLLAGLVPALGACEPFAITSFGVGASTAVSHSLGGITYRTFTASAQQVRSASNGEIGRAHV